MVTSLRTSQVLVISLTLLLNMLVRGSASSIVANVEASSNKSATGDYYISHDLRQLETSKTNLRGGGGHRQLAVDCADVILEDDAFYLIKGYDTESKDTGDSKFVFMSDSYRVRAHRHPGIEEDFMNNMEFVWKVVNLHTNQHGRPQFVLYNPYRHRYMVKGDDVGSNTLQYWVKGKEEIRDGDKDYLFLLEQTCDQPENGFKIKQDGGDLHLKMDTSDSKLRWHETSGKGDRFVFIKVDADIREGYKMPDKPEDGLPGGDLLDRVP